MQYWNKSTGQFDDLEAHYPFPYTLRKDYPEILSTPDAVLESFKEQRVPSSHVALAFFLALVWTCSFAAIMLVLVPTHYKLDCFVDVELLAFFTYINGVVGICCIFSPQSAPFFGVVTYIFLVMCTEGESECTFSMWVVLWVFLGYGPPLCFILGPLMRIITRSE